MSTSSSTMATEQSAPHRSASEARFCFWIRATTSGTTGLREGPSLLLGGLLEAIGGQANERGREARGRPTTRGV